MAVALGPILMLLPVFRCCQECIDPWLETKAVCAYCKAQVEAKKSCCDRMMRPVSDRLGLNLVAPTTIQFSSSRRTYTNQDVSFFCFVFSRVFVFLCFFVFLFFCNICFATRKTNHVFCFLFLFFFCAGRCNEACVKALSGSGERVLFFVRSAMVVGSLLLLGERYRGKKSGVKQERKRAGT